MGFYKISIQGIVQGVGFRPFLFNLANKFGFTGSIVNKGNIGVELLVYTDTPIDISKFISAIYSKKPVISFIESINTEELDPDSSQILDKSLSTKTLQIMPSLKGVGPSITSPPDIAMCSKCVMDMKNPKNSRFYQYPFTACAECGPRFTTIRQLPYDREHTTMQEFPYCHPSHELEDSCLMDYNNPQNRRFHAETYSCVNCGPNYFFLFNLRFHSTALQDEASTEEINRVLKDHEGIFSHARKSVQIAAEYIKSGKILAVMGIGGVHIVGDARDSDVIETIRKRKRKRKTKPFAIMVRDIRSAERLVYLSKKEKVELNSFRRPIVLAPKKLNVLPDSLAPGLQNLGIMLPYAGIHYLLFNSLGEIPLIYTSGNFSELPMAITPHEVVKQLGEIVDGYLLHNREIFQRADDSVLRVQNGYTKIIRRSRGYVPEYFSLPFQTQIKGGIAVGPDLNSTGLVARGHRLFPTQHIGNVNTLETYDFLKNAIFHMKSLLQLENSDMDFIAMDLHPQFQSTRLANILKNEMHIPNSFTVQHHFAHAASLMVDSGIERTTPVIVSTLDGVGYGLDGKVWGGEIIRGIYNDMKRTHHLSYVPMIGGDLCVKFPARMVMGFLLKSYDPETAKSIADSINLQARLQRGATELDSMISNYEVNESIAYSSSCGRLLDSISNLLGLCDRKFYEGEPAMRLEGTASSGNPHAFDFSSSILLYLEEHPQETIIPSEKIFEQILNVVKGCSIHSIKLQNIAASSLYSIGKIFGFVSFQEARKYNIRHVGLSGGVAYNDLLSRGFYEYLHELSQKDNYPLNLLHHDNVPPGDAGISSGQAAIAISKIS